MITIAIPSLFTDLTPLALADKFALALEDKSDDKMFKRMSFVHWVMFVEEVHFIRINV